MSPMVVIRARYPDAQAFLDAYEADPPGGALFCPTTKPLAPGDEIVVEVHFPELPNKELLRGRVVSWRPAVPRLRVRAGARVVFPPTEARKRDFVLDVARGERPKAKRRRHARLPVEIPVRWRAQGSPDFRQGALRQISVGGAQLVTDGDVAPGEDLLVELTPPGGSCGFPVASKVTYESDDHYGLRFIYRDGGGKRRLRELVRRLVHAGAPPPG